MKPTNSRKKHGHQWGKSLSEDARELLGGGNSKPKKQDNKK